MDVKEYIQQASEVHGFALEVARAMAGIQQMPEFSSEEMTIADASKLTGFPETSIRAGILNNWLPIGVATQNGKQVYGNVDGRIKFYIFPRKVWEVTGHVWRGAENL